MDWYALYRQLAGLVCLLKQTRAVSIISYAALANRRCMYVCMYVYLIV